MFHRDASPTFGPTRSRVRIGVTQLREQGPSFERRATGIEGLDRILDGGFLVSGVYIVQGPPGAGKTTQGAKAILALAAAPANGPIKPGGW